MLKLSIITINLNNAEGLRKTIESVANQTFTDYEYIIIDGGSTDGSVDVINSYTDKITFWRSEPDKGIYNAMNKGIEQTVGMYLLFLNSGDYLYSNDTLFNSVINLDDQDIYYGNICLCDNKSECFIYRPPQDLTFYYFFSSTLLHPSTIIKKSLFQKYGYYNEDLKVSSDYEFFLTSLFIHHATFKYIDITISVFITDGMSSKIEFKKLIQDERKYILNKYFPLFVNDYQLLSIFLQTPMGRFVHNLSHYNYTFKLLNKVMGAFLLFYSKFKTILTFFTRQKSIS